MKKRFKPEVGDRYYIISGYGDILAFAWNNDNCDVPAFRFGNCFATREEARSALVRVKKALKGC